MLINFANKKYYSEITQSSSTTFAFVNEVAPEEFTELFDPVKCRDFLGDVVFADKYKCKAGIFGFEFDGTSQKLDKDATKLSVHFKDMEEMNRFLNNLAILLDVEDNNQLERTQVYLPLYKDVLIIKGDPFWQSAQWTISLYTHLLRCLGSPDIDKLFIKTYNYPEYSRESEYMQRIGLDNWTKLISNLRKIKEAADDPSGYGDTTTNSMNKLHNCCGIATLFGKNVVQGNKYREAFDKL